MHDITLHVHAQTLPGLIVYRFDAPLFFPNAQHFTTRVRALLAIAKAPLRQVLKDTRVWDELGEAAFFPTVRTGVSAYRQQTE